MSEVRSPSLDSDLRLLKRLISIQPAGESGEASVEVDPA
jgi:hypothetical protein